MGESWTAESLDLLSSAAPAVLATYRKDGSVSVSPVWFRLHNDVLQVVLADGDVKLRHLGRDPRCSLTIFETEPPFRGVRVEGSARLAPDHGNEARLGIASRYLGAERGQQFVELREVPGQVLTIDPPDVTQWDLGSIIR